MTKQLLGAIMEISQQMTMAGAEIHRVEESVTRICTAYGAVRTDVFATTSHIIVSVEMPDDNILTQSRRMRSSGTDLEKLDKLNALARDITATTPSCEEIRERLAAITAMQPYPAWAQILFFGIIAGPFCLFFGGWNAAECVTAIVIALLSGALAQLVSHFTVNKVLGRFLCSLLACSLAFAATKWGLIATPDNVIIGNIMTLISGVGLTNSLRDLFTGDTITGILRSIEAVLLAAAIACGYVLTVFLFGGVV